jgi:hypothetical protein
MAYNFDLKKYLTENKLTSNSKLNESSDVKEIKANTSKLFNWFWDASPAKDIARRVSDLNDEDLLSLYDEAEDLKRNGRLNNPRQIQLALLKKEINRRGL